MRNVEHAKGNVSETLRTLAYLDVREAELEEEAIGVCDVLIPRSATKDPRDIQIYLDENTWRILAVMYPLRGPLCAKERPRTTRCA